MILSNIVNKVMNVTSMQQVKNLELKEGQVFKGNVVKLLPNDLALVQIGGVNITAKLEIPMQVGQQTWLQVQAGSNPITLKVISNKTPQNKEAPVSSVNELLYALGINPTRENEDTTQNLIKEQMPLTPKIIDDITNLKASLGKSDGLVESMAYLMKKGIPVTPQAVQAVREFGFGNGVSSTIQNLINELENYIVTSGAGAGEISNERSRQSPEINKEVVNQKEIKVEPDANDGEAQVQGTPRDLSGKLVKVLKDISNDYEKLTIQNSQEKSQNQTEAEQLATEFSAKGENILNIFKKLGINHEKNLLSLLIDQFPGVQDETTPKDNVKSLLMELKNHGDMIPKQLSDSVETMLQQITGQQLMMSPDNSQSMFQQIAFQIPFPNSEQNALIQVESRKQGKGSIDPENCRLFFYLDMVFLGPTIVDVNVVDKVMNVTIQTNFVGIEDLIQTKKAELANSLRNIGYHLSSLKVSENSTKAASSKDGMQKNPYSAYSNYQGMDIRV